MNLAEMKAAVRQDLHDNDGSNYRWTDEELDRHIRHAVSDYSERLPLESKETIATTNGARELDIGGITDRVMLEAVEYPAEELPKRYQPFSLWGETVTLIGEEVPDGSDANIYYGKIHDIDAGGSTIPARHEDLIVSGAAGYAAVAWAMYAVNRVNAGGPATPKEFLEWGNQRLKLFREELRRLGRRNRVRVSSLFAPAYPARRKSMDYGPA